ncbi:MAG: hypothetical protein AAGK32_22670, partial [Actinomycetota bacterium]
VDDLTGAAGAYRIAVDSGHPAHSPEAAIALGLMLERRLDVLAGAAAAFEQAVAAEHPERSPEAAEHLARVTAAS